MLGDAMTEQDFLYNYRGRREIFTNEREITRDNVIKVLQEVMPYFEENREQCEYLINYDAGIQPLQRKKEKTYRPDIDFTNVANVANEITEFKLGYQWVPITLVQRGTKDSGGRTEADAITLLNESYQAEGIDGKTQRLGRFVEICGVGYTFVDVKTDWQDGDSYFEVEVFDPRTTFVVRSNRFADNRVIMGVTFRQDYVGNRWFTCFTKDSRYEVENLNIVRNGKQVVEWNQLEKSGSMNPLGMIPIIEWVRSYDRMGCFERQISECDALNLLNSDFLNDVDQNTQAIWHTNDVEFPEEQTETTDADGNTVTTTSTKRPASGEWLETFTSPDGKTPFVKPLTLDYDYQGILKNIEMKHTSILQRCNVPQRNDNSGGSTGVAMSDATGWSAAEAAAQKQQAIMESCKMDELRVVLKAIQISPHVPSDSPLLDLRPMDVKPNIKRQKTYEMITKANAFATYVSHGVNGLHALRVTGAFDDIQQVWEDSKDGIQKYQKSIYDPEKTVDVNESKKENFSENPVNQISNSPNIDGMSKEDPNEEPKDDAK